MKYVYVKDPEGFVVKKPASEVSAEETVISAAEYHALSGDDYYTEHFTHGGKRKGAGRKAKYSQPLDRQMRVTEQERQFILFAREHNVDYSALASRIE